MNEPHNDPRNESNLNALKRQARLNSLRLKIAQQNAALEGLRRAGHADSLEGYYDSSNYFDSRDYLFETPRFGGAMPTTLNDRDQGRDYPIFRAEQDLAVIRGAARLLTTSNPIASGLLTSLTNYVIGTGFQYSASPRDVSAVDLAKLASQVIEEFLDENNWLGDLDRELFQRSRVDGEYFLGLWHVGDGHVQVRSVEPDQVTEPANKAGLDTWLGCKEPTNWTFGVQTDEADAQAVHGYFVMWSNRDQDWDFLSGGNEPIIPPGGGLTWLAHAKLNVVRSVKRGLSDFYPIQGNLDIARRVLRNMGEGSAVQAAIAWIQEVAPGTTQAQAHSGTLSRADASYTTRTAQGSDRTHYVQQYDPATILKVPSGQKYLPGPLAAQNAASFISAAEALLRSVAVRWNLPENLVTGSAANNNFASSLVAETPFVKYAESQQQFYAQRDRKTLERVLWMAWRAGRFGEADWRDIKRGVQIIITPPQIEARDPEKETAVRKTLFEAGVLSKTTWAAQEGLDFEQEQKNLQMEAEAAAKANPRPGDQPHPGRDPRDSAESFVQEVWDPAKHPRGGDSHFPQRFSEGWGSGGVVPQSLSPNSGSGEQTAGSNSRTTPMADRAPGHSSAPDTSRPDDGNTVLLNIPGHADRLQERDAEALDHLAAGIFQSEPIEHWNIAALQAVLKFQSARGTPISAELQDKFLAYVREQQGNAKLRHYFEDSLRKLGTAKNDAKNDPASSDNELSTVLLDVTQMGLDLSGVLDPTPISDGANTLVSLGRGEMLDAGINAVSMIPYLGDLAKIGKLGKYPQKLARAISLALKSEKAGKLIKPVLEKLSQLLERIPLNKLPDGLRKPLESLKNQLDNFFRKTEGKGKQGPGGHGRKGALTDIQARDWYNSEIAKIDSIEQQLRAQGKTAKEISEKTTMLRNEAKLRARALMQDQALAKSLPPLKTPEQILQKYGGDYEKAIDASKRTNIDVNKAIDERRARGEM